MSRSEELALSIGICVIGLIVLVVLMGGIGAFALYGGTFLFFFGMSTFPGDTAKPGWRLGTSTGFVAVALFEAIWELYINKLPNSLPGFVFLFMSFPLACVGLVPAWLLVQRARSNRTLVHVGRAFVSIFLCGSIPVVLSVADVSM